MVEYKKTEDYMNKICKDIERIVKKYPELSKTIYEPLEIPKTPDKLVEQLSEIIKTNSIEIEKERSIVDAKTICKLIEKL